MNPSSTGPSKQFLIRGGITIAAVALILISQTQWFKGLFHKKTASGEAQVVGDLIARDSNGNGLPDWEEKLWGLDPTTLYTDGKSNLEIIKEKKLSVGIKETDDSEPLDQTDQIARSLFSLSTAVGDSDRADSGAIQSAAANIGASVDIDTIYPHYSYKNLKTVKTTAQSLRTYQKQLDTILSSYDPDMADINVIVSALQTGDFSNVSQLNETAATYRVFAGKIAALSVPVGLASFQLDIMNGFYGMADSFTYLTKIEDNALGGLSGIAAYRKYDLELETALLNMRAYLVQYGILSE
ncbi:MAG: hypothetical protein V4478_02200 [Patescibacteria group bacterium]